MGKLELKHVRSCWDLRRNCLSNTLFIQTLKARGRYRLLFKGKVSDLPTREYKVDHYEKHSRCD